MTSKPRLSKSGASLKIGFVGAGKIAESIITGLVMHGKVDPKRIYVAAPSGNNSDRLKDSFPGLKVSRRNLDIFGKFDCEVVFLCVNGNVIHHLYVLGGMRPAPLTTNYIPNMKHQLYVLTLITGYTVEQVKKVLLNPEHPDKYMLEMHRVVMNCSAAQGLGVCAIDVEPDSRKLGEPIRALLTSIAKLEYIPEAQMDAACAMCGAGLAVAYYFINAMASGGLKVGLGRAQSVKFAAKTVNCATQALLESGKNPSELKDEVCAPSAAAIFALSVLDKTDASSGVAGAIEAAHKRATALAKGDTSLTSVA